MLIEKSIFDNGLTVAPAPDNLNPPHILVVDDDRDIRKLILDILIFSGYKVDVARDGAEGWKALKEIDYHLLITDHKMPRVTGLELIKKLRSENMTLPVILVSGTVPTQELKLYPWLRIDATLPKPFTPANLLDVVKKVLDTVSETPFADLMLHPEKLAAALKNTKIPEVEELAIAPPRNPTDLSHRILVVDDDRDTRQLNMDVLTESGYAVEAAVDGAAGWEALQKSRYDLIITDNQMPRMTGIEMIAKLRNARMAVPIIMATGNLPMKAFTHNPWLRPEAMLQMPFTNDDLLETVRTVLQGDNGNDGCEETLIPKYL